MITRRSFFKGVIGLAGLAIASQIPLAKSWASAQVRDLPDTMDAVHEAPKPTYIIKAIPGGGFPVGAMQVFLCSPGQVPTGWVPCDGRKLPRHIYRHLYAVIGNNYGGSHYGTLFRVPHYMPWEMAER